MSASINFVELSKRLITKKCAICEICLLSVTSYYVEYILSRKNKQVEKNRFINQSSVKIEHSQFIIHSKTRILILTLSVALCCYACA